VGVSDQRKWDARFLEMAKLVSRWSKDPSTQTGAVIVDPWNRMLSVGFNGFPQRLQDDERLQNRELKYEMIVHCEVNAMIFVRGDIIGCTLYTWPFMSCSRCASVMIQAGISRHISLVNDNPRWAGSFALSKRLFDEAKVEVILYDGMMLNEK
jgi:dCMP deaminase